MVITVHCPECASSFPVDSNKIPERGVNARCSSCGHVFRIERPAEEAPPVPPAAPEPVVDEAPHFGAVAEPEAAEPEVAEAEPEAEPEVEAEVAETAEAEPDAVEEEPFEEPAPEEPDAGASAEAAETEEAPVDTGWGIEPLAAAPEPVIEPPVTEEVEGTEGTEGIEEIEEIEESAGADDELAAELPEIEAEGALEIETPAFETPEDQDSEQEADVSAEVETPALADDTSDWVFETEPDIDPGSLDIEPLDTVQSSADEVDVEESPHFGDTAGFEMEDMTLDEPSTEAVDDERAGDAGSSLDEDLAFETTSFEAPALEDVETAESAFEVEASEAEASEPTIETSEPLAFEEPAAAAPEPEEAAASAPVAGFTFGKRDPTEKARRLARVLVSDMIMYNPDRHERALANGTLKEDFEDEIAKSWKEYVDQVGQEMAQGNTFWTDALNDILARGESVF